MKNWRAVAFVRKLFGWSLSGIASALGVPLLAVSIFLPSDAAKVGFGVLAAVCLAVSAYRLWNLERPRADDLQTKLEQLQDTRPLIELQFDDRDDQYVRDKKSWYTTDPIKTRGWWIGIRNASLTASAENVIVRAHPSWFVDHTVSKAIGRRELPNVGEPIIYYREALEPGARDFFLLFEASPHPPATQDVLARPHNFTLEVGARNAPTMQAQFHFEPTVPPTITRVS